MAEADTKPLLPLTQAGSASPCRGLGTNWLFNFLLGRLPGEVQSLPRHTSCGHRPGEQGHLAAWQLTHLSQRQLGVGQSTFQHQRESSGIHGEMSDDRVGRESPYNLPSYRLLLLNIRKKVHATNHGPPRYRTGGGTGREMKPVPPDDSPTRQCQAQGLGGAEKAAHSSPLAALRTLLGHLSFAQAALPEQPHLTVGSSSDAAGSQSQKTQTLTMGLAGSWVPAN